MSHTCDTTKCLVHARNTRVKGFMDEGSGVEKGFSAAATYIGEYAVLTQINPLFNTPIGSIATAIGNPVDIFITSVYYVGDGPLVTEDGTGECRYVETHTDNSKFSAESGDEYSDDYLPFEQAGLDHHNSVVEMVKSGLVDLSTKVTGQQQEDAIRASVKFQD